MLWNDSTDIHDFFAGGSLEYGSNPCNWPDPRSPHLINLHLSLQPQGRKAQLSPQMPWIRLQRIYRRHHPQGSLARCVIFLPHSSVSLSDSDSKS